jgi:hypothetical protein
MWHGLRNTYKVFVGLPDWRRYFGDVNIKVVHYVVGWIYMAYVKVRWLAFLSLEIQLCISLKYGEFIDEMSDYQLPK